MSTKHFKGQKAAILVENGFCEREFIQSQEALTSLGFLCRIISSQDKIVNAWNELGGKSSDWGGQYAPNETINTAQPSNYEILVIPGGKRSIEKLKLCNGLKSFLSGFVNTRKPVLLYNAAHDLLTDAGLMDSDKIPGVPAVMATNGNIISIFSYADCSDAICNTICKIMSADRACQKQPESVGTEKRPYKAA